MDTGSPKGPPAAEPSSPVFLGEEVALEQMRILERVASGAPLRDILTACLRLCESQSPGMLGSILLLDPDSTVLRHGAAPGLPEEYIKAIDGSSIGPRAGSCGTAAFRAQPVFVEDIASDPLWADYKDIALPHGLRACWSTPIFDVKRRVLGTFAMYYREPGLPAARHKDLIGMVTHLASIAIACRRAEMEKRQIYERISDAFVALDKNWRYTFVNEKAAQFFGRTPESLVGKHIWSEFPEGVGRTFQLAYERAMKEQTPLRIEEYYPPFERWFENRVFPSPEGVSIYFLDITERKRAEETLRQTEKLTAIGQMAGGIAHDFNNQLSIIMGYAELLAKRNPDPDLRRYAQSILSAARSSGELTRNLLTFSRRGHFESVPVDLHELVDEVVGLISHSFDKRILIRRSLEAERTLVIGDPASLQNALLNLALNARDAMPRGGELEFATMLEGEFLVLRVSDTGTGMTEEVKKRIFEPFFTTKPVGKGTGMGLASVFGTVRIHKGRIAVDSVPDGGTSFHIHLPLAMPDPATELRPAGAPALDRALTILVVEDDGDIGAMVGDMLGSDGHHVIHAPGGREALRLYGEHASAIDLVLLDMVMPGMDGHDTFHALRALDPKARILLTSGFSPEGRLRSLLEEGVLGLLQKPYDKVQLVRMIAHAMAASAP